MKLTRRAAQRVNLVIAVRRAEKTPAPQLNYDSIFDGLFALTPEKV